MSFFKDRLKQDEMFLMESKGFSSEKISLTQFPLLMHLMCHNISCRSKKSRVQDCYKAEIGNLMWQMGENEQGDRRDAAEG